MSPSLSLSDQQRAAKRKLKQLERVEAMKKIEQERGEGEGDGYSESEGDEPGTTITTISIFSAVV